MWFQNWVLGTGNWELETGKFRASTWPVFALLIWFVACRWRCLCRCLRIQLNSWLLCVCVSRCVSNLVGNGRLPWEVCSINWFLCSSVRESVCGFENFILSRVYVYKDLWKEIFGIYGKYSNNINTFINFYLPQKRLGGHKLKIQTNPIEALIKSLSCSRWDTKWYAVFAFEIELFNQTSNSALKIGHDRARHMYSLGATELGSCNLGVAIDIDSGKFNEN